MRTARISARLNRVGFFGFGVSKKIEAARVARLCAWVGNGWTVGERVPKPNRATVF